jgi:hypothetical protein
LQLDATALMKALDPIYDKAITGVSGVPGLEPAKGLAEDYPNDPGLLEDKVNALIRYQVLKATTSGFVTGLGGVLILPVTVPVNLASVMYVQLQMVAAIAYMGGHQDLSADRVKTVCYACLCGNAAIDVLKGTGIVIGKKLTEQAIKSLSFETIKTINKAVGFRLLTKFGQTGAINLGKAIPLVGGVVGGAFDGTTTYTIGKVAKNVFITAAETPRDEQPHHEDRMDIIERLSVMQFPEDDEQNGQDPQRKAQERQDRWFF